MPTYEFTCPRGHEFEQFYRKISDAPAEVSCPTCGALAARQVSGGAGLLFKGSGFYLTDYGKNAHRAGEAKKAGEAKGGESSATGDAGGAKSADAPKSPDAKPAETKPAETKPAAPPKKSE